MSVATWNLKKWELQQVKASIEELQNKYDNLNQISMQGKEGSELLTRINILNSELNKLEQWFYRKW